jgi:hypothetical protein
VAGAGKVGVREAEDGIVLVAVAGGPGIALLEVAHLGVRAQLDHAEGAGRAGEGVAVAAGADEDVDLGGLAFCRTGGGRAMPAHRRPVASEMAVRKCRLIIVSPCCNFGNIS